MARKFRTAPTIGLAVFGLSMGGLYLLSPLLESDQSLRLPVNEEPPQPERFERPRSEPNSVGAVLARFLEKRPHG